MPFSIMFDEGQGHTWRSKVKHSPISQNLFCEMWLEFSIEFSLILSHLLTAGARGIVFHKHYMFFSYAYRAFIVKHTAFL